MINNLTVRKAISLVITLMAVYVLDSHADDTEIYFSDLNRMPKPNVIFLLDTSGSMNFTLNYKQVINASGNSDTTKSRLASLKEAVETIMANKDIKNLRMGVLDFSDNTTIRIKQEVVDIDEIDEQADIPPSDRVAKGNNSTILTQRVLIPTDDGKQSGVNNVPDLGDGIVFITNDNFLSGFRFDNILLKNPSQANITDVNRGITKAELILTPQYRLYSTINLTIYIDPAINASRLNSSYFGDFSRRTIGASKTITIVGSNLGSDGLIKIDVTDLIREKINNVNWQRGYAIAFIIKGGRDIRWKAYENNKETAPHLTLEVDNKLIAENKRIQREKMMDAVAGFKSGGGTYIVSNLLAASRYISSIRGDYGSVGPYHFPLNYNSPIIDDCHMSHIILMTDGKPEGDSSGPINAKRYIGQNSYARCLIFDAQDKSTFTYETPYKNSMENCGRALASWMARTSHAITNTQNTQYKSGAFVRTHTIGFAMQIGSGEQQFLEDLANAG